MRWHTGSWVIGAWYAPTWNCGIPYKTINGRVHIYPRLEAGVTIKRWED